MKVAHDVADGRLRYEVQQNRRITGLKTHVQQSGAGAFAQCQGTGGIHGHHRRPETAFAADEAEDGTARNFSRIGQTGSNLLDGVSEHLIVDGRDQVLADTGLHDLDDMLGKLVGGNDEKGRVGEMTPKGIQPFEDDIAFPQVIDNQDIGLLLMAMGPFSPTLLNHW